jgi:hypothetical protein
MFRPYFASMVAALTLVACGGGFVHVHSAKYPVAADRLERAEQGAVAAGCKEQSAGHLRVTFRCENKFLIITDEGNEGMSIACRDLADGDFSEQECGAMLDDFLAYDE